MSLKLVKLAKQRHSKSPIEWLTGQPATTVPTSASPLLQAEVGFADATKLDPTDEQIFLANLKVRFLNKQIYTCLESTVIAINPCEQLPLLFTREVIAAYEHHNILTLPPHIFALCEHVLLCLKERNTDQCIVASGVSGSGKTESLKIALSYFINGSSSRSELSQIKARLSSISTLLEAFGNASTEHNSNSTRMVYVLEIDFDFSGDPLGGQISDYFLEKTRVAKQEIYGLNFHIFYQMIGGAGSNLLKFLKLKRNVDSYTLLKEGKKCESVPLNAQQIAEDFRKTKSTLQLLGFTSNEIIECFQVLAFILKLGNVNFLRRANIDSTEGCTILADYEIVDICNAFQLDVALFQKLLTQKIVQNENDVFIAELSAKSATKVRNSLCKALYYRLFTWLIGRINELAKTKPSTNVARNNLSLIDSFGFEKYNINCFEQLLINYFYEKIEQFFVDFSFRQEQENYIREEIDWQPIHVNSNDLLCDLIERPIKGIFSTLDEECAKTVYFREEIFIQNLNKHCESDLHYTSISNPVLVESDGTGSGYFVPSLPYRRLSAGDISKSLPQLCFAVKHFLGNVVYSINGFIEKNTDHISRDWSYLLYKSDHCLLKILFPEGNPVRKNPKKPITLANQFLISIEGIIAKLQNKQLHFIKCIRPNQLKMPNMFDDEYVYKQLRSQFIIEHGDFLKAGYFHSERYSLFFRRYRMLSAQTWPNWTGTPLNGVYLLLFQLYDGQLGEFAFGKTKIFVKNLKILTELEEWRMLKLIQVATKIQKNIRAWLQRRKYLRLLFAQIKIVRYYRNWKRKRYLKWLARHLPSRSPLSREWPPAPRSLKESSHLLRRLHHKWRCQRYRTRFDQTNRNRMREKVTAMALFRNRKASYRNSVSHPFRGDYIRLRQNVKWKRLLPTLGEVYVVFADLVSKITKRCGKFAQKLVVISTSSFIILDHKTMQVNHLVKLQDIFKISTSPYMDNIFVIHIYTDQQGLNSRAFLFESSHLIELITKLFLVIQNSVGRGPTLEISHEFQVHTGKETLVLLFKSRNPPSEAPTHEVKISRKSNRLEITI